jgi:type I protein arginine methyltransferase
MTQARGRMGKRALANVAFGVARGRVAGPSPAAALRLSMPFSPLRRLSAGFFARLRAGLRRLGASVQARPALAAWVYGEPDEAERVTDAALADENYRNFNHRYFAGFGEQEKMLADGPRMAFYAAAVARRVRPGDRVIDLGTGTGILAAFAARRGAARVYALDHSDILRQARRLAEANGLANVEFVATHSRDFALPERVDVILHEQMGDYLFDEAMVGNVLDLRDRLLRPGGLVVPSRFEFFCEPAKVRDERHIPFLWELKVDGYDYACLESERPENSDYYRHMGCDPGMIEHFLGAASPALEIDLMTLRPEEPAKELTIVRAVVNPGRLDGFVVFFRALDGDDLALSSSPLDPGRAPHWGFRILRTEKAEFAAGEVIALTLRVGSWAEPDGWRWSWSREPGAPPTSTQSIRIG